LSHLKNSTQKKIQTGRDITVKSTQKFATAETRRATSLLWFIQRHFSGTELGRFTRSVRLQGRHPASLFSEPQTLLTASLDALSPERRSTLECRMNDLLTEETHSDLLSRADVEHLTHKELPDDFPLALRFQGEPEVLKRKKVAIVGSRHPTFYGREQSARFARALAEHGLCVVSGAAIGIDTVANICSHECGMSVAVLGSGLMTPYPRSNIALLHALGRSGRGLILSEFDDFQRAEKWNFPKRNRIIAALCDFLLVIEAALGSGTLITAHLAADYGIEVGALPGPVHSPNSQGSNQLIKEGAFCIERPEEILERFVNLSHQWGRIQETSENESEFYRPPLSPLF
jgi:DNA protecting protein DprA